MSHVYVKNQNLELKHLKIMSTNKQTPCKHTNTNKLKVGETIREDGIESTRKIINFRNKG